MWDKFLWVNVVIFVIAFVYTVLVLKSLVRSIRSYLRYRSREQVRSKKRRNSLSSPIANGFQSKRTQSKRTPISWADLSWSDQLEFINPWFLSTMIATSCNMIMSVSNISFQKSYTPTMASHKLISGFGTSLLWINLVRYLEHNKQVSLSRTYNNILPKYLTPTCIFSFTP